MCSFRSRDPRAKGYVLKSDFVGVLHRQLGLNSHSGVDIPSLVESLSVGEWVPYPRFLAMFEGQASRDTVSGATTNVSSASLDPEKLKVHASCIRVD